MFFVEDVRLASPTQLASIQRRRAFLKKIKKRAFNAPPLKVISAVPVTPIQDKLPTDNMEKDQTTLEDAAPCGNPADVVMFASHIANIIIHICAKKYCANRDEIIGRVRAAYIVEARHAAYYLAKKLTKWSSPEIGRRIGNRDHTTILSGLKKVERLRAERPEYAAELDRLVAVARERIVGCSPSTVPAVCERDVPEQQEEGEWTGEEKRAGTEVIA